MKFGTVIVYTEKGCRMLIFSQNINNIHLYNKINVTPTIIFYPKSWRVLVKKCISEKSTALLYI